MGQWPSGKGQGITEATLLQLLSSNWQNNVYLFPKCGIPAPSCNSLHVYSSERQTSAIHRKGELEQLLLLCLTYYTYVTLRAKWERIENSSLASCCHPESITLQTCSSGAELPFLPRQDRSNTGHPALNCTPPGPPLHQLNLIITLSYR